MIARSIAAVLLTVVVVFAAVEFSSWVLGRAVSAVLPSVSEVEADVPQAQELDAPASVTAPGFTW